MSACLRSEAVGRRRQVTGVALAVVLYLVDELLRMLHTHAEGERLGLKQPAVALKHIVYIARGMARGQYHGIAGYIAAVSHHAADTAIPDNQVGNPCIEAVFATGLLNRAAHVGDDAAEAVGADMCVSLKHNVGVGAMLHKRAQHRRDVAALGGARI